MTIKFTQTRIPRLVLTLGILALALASTPSKRTANPTANLLNGSIPPGVRSLMSLYGADAVTLDRNARDYKMLKDIEWQSSPGTTAQTATVFGDPSKPGMYVTLLKRGPDDWSQPHTHPNERYLTVLAGTMLVGTGTKFDKKNVVAMGPGSMIHDIANQSHYDGTGPEGLILETVSIGPNRQNAKQ